MSRLLFTVLITLLLTPHTWAQGTSSHLTLLSEDGSPFFVYLNGIQYNQQPATAVRIEHLTSNMYQCRIVFSDRRLPELMHRSLAVTDIDGYAQDISYLISTKRRGDRAFSVYQIIPMEPIEIQTRNMVIYQAGRPNKPERWNDDDHRFRKNYHNQRYRTIRNPQHPVDIDRRNDFLGKGTNCLVMDNRTFNDAVKTISKASFDVDKLNIAKTIVNANCLTTDQIATILKLFSFEDNKLELAKWAYPNCLDKQQYFNIINLLSFSSSKNELSRFLDSQH